MKIIFFGLGSIGKRHAEILSKNPEIELVAYRSKKGNRIDLPNISEVYTWDEVEASAPDAAFITNPTCMHVDTALKCAKMGMNLFIEKPVDCSNEGLDQLIDETKKRKLATYVAYNLRFHPVVEYLKEYLEDKQVSHVEVYCSSHLHGWRKDKDPLESYSAHAKKGGGVILDLSHEFDYIDYLFDGIKGIEGTFGKAGNVTVDAEDFADAVIETNAATVNLHMNFFSMHTERTIKINCEDEYLHADLLNNSIEFYREKGKELKHFTSGTKETYKSQIDYFMQNIDNDKMMNNLIDASVLFDKILAFKGKQR